VTARLLSHFNARLCPIVGAVRAWSRWRGRAAGLAGTDLSLPSRPVNAALESILAGEGRLLVDLLHGRKRRGYAAGVSLVALLRRDDGAIVRRTQPGDLAPDTYDPATGRRFLVHGNEASGRTRPSPPCARGGAVAVGRSSIRPGSAADESPP